MARKEKGLRGKAAFLKLLAPDKIMNEAERIVRATLDSLSAHIAIVEVSGEIVLTNEAWRRFASANGIDWHEVSEGANYLDACDAAGDAGEVEAAAFAEGLRSVLDGRPGFDAAAIARDSTERAFKS